MKSGLLIATVLLGIGFFFCYEAFAERGITCHGRPMRPGDYCDATNRYGGYARTLSYEDKQAADVPIRITFFVAGVLFVAGGGVVSRALYGAYRREREAARATEDGS